MRKHLLFLLLALLPMVAMQAQTTYYNLTICGRQVSNQNANNILGDTNKSFVYDASTKTLTVKGDKSVESGNIINNGIDGLTLNIARDVTFESTGSNLMIYNQGDCSMTVKGDGKLTMSNPNGFAGCFYVQGDATLTIDNMEIDGEGQNVFWGDKSTEKLVLKNSTIHAKCTGGGFGAIFELGGGITFDNCHIALPLGAYVDMTTFMGIVQSNGQIARDVTIEPGEGVEYYPLLICGQYVNANNADDVLGDGVFSYNAATTTLTISGDCTTYEGGHLINSSIDGLVINVATDSKLHLSGHNNNIMNLQRNTTIKGDGKLEMSGEYHGFYCYASLTLEDLNLYVDGDNTCFQDGNLTIRNSTVMTTTLGNQAFDCHSIVLEDCHITRPDGGYVWGGTIYDSNSEPAWDVYIKPGEDVNPIVVYPLDICGKKVTSNNASNILGDGVFSYDAETQTLTVSGDCTYDDGYIIDSRIEGLVINIATNSTLTSENYNRDVVYLGGNTTLKGDGKLTISSEFGGFVFTSSFTLEDINIDINGNSTCFYSSRGQLIIHNSSVHAQSIERQAFDCSSIVLEDCHITLPEDGYVNGNTIYDSDGNKALEVTIEPGEDVNPTLLYDLVICGKQVTNKNAADVLRDGAFSYDAENKVLTVSGDASTDEEYVIYNKATDGCEGIDGLTIDFQKDVKFTTTGREGTYIPSYGCIRLDANTTLKGEGTLTIESSGFGILAQSSTLTIEGMTIEANCAHDGIIGKYMDPAPIQIISSNIHVKAGDSYVAFFSFSEFILEGCEITQPEGAYHSVDDYGCIVDSEGKRATEVWIKPIAVEYGLTICGTTVTSENAADVLGDGAFRYDNGTKTLYVKGDASTTGYKNVISNRNGLNGLTIYVANDVTLSADINVIEAAYSNSATITGPGKLTLKSEDGGGIYCSTSTVTIDDMDIDITGCDGFRGNGAATSGNNFVVRNSRVYINAQECATANIGLTLEGCAIRTPEGGRVENGHIVDSQGNVALEALIEPVVETYDLWICGVDVTSRNADDVLGDGAFSYDAENKVLTVSGDIPYYSDSGIISNIEDLTVNVTQNVKMSTGFATIIFYNNATLTGTDSLTLHSDTDCGIYIYKATLTIDNLNIEADGKWGLAGYPYKEYLIVRNSNIHAKGTEAAFCDFNSITLEGCSVTLPEGGYVDGGNIVDSEGNVAKEATISTGAVTIEGLAADSNKNTARYNLAGQRVGRDYKGIVIEGGKKTLVK